MRLKDKVVVIVGSTSGIGEASAILCAKEGAKVVVSGRRKERGDQVVEKIKAFDGEAIFIQTDVMKESDIQYLMDEAVRVYGKIDVLVNCFGGGRVGPLHTLTSEDWDYTITLDAKAMFLSMKYGITKMLEHKSGSVINISSTAINTTLPNNSLYNFSKTGLNAMTKVAAVDYASQGIRCNIVAPGYTDTELIAHIPAEMKEKICQSIPMKRMATAEEVAFAVLFLASDESSYCSGQIIDVNGAWAI